MHAKNPYDTFDNLPGKTFPAETKAFLAPLTFLQNLEIDAGSNIVFTSLLDGRLWRLPFGGTPQLVAQVDGRISGVLSTDDGGWLLFGWSMRGEVVTFLVRPNGEWKIFTKMPEAVGPNGGQRMPGGHYLMADSMVGAIWDVHYPSGEVTKWHQDPLYGRAEGTWEPALNGLRVWKNHLYMTNTSRQLLLRIPIADGKPAGAVEVVREGLGLDDFAFDAEGSMYIATHPQDTVLKLTQGGVLTRVAGAAEGVRGCTACRFGQRPGDETGLYVVTEGGLFNPLSGGTQPARVVRLEAGVKGAPIDFF